jgi:hypothetical protein
LNVSVGSQVFEDSIALAIEKLFFVSIAPYIQGAGSSSYGDKRGRNKPIGPGGGTRRLHQILFAAPCGPLSGGESQGAVKDLWGRNRIDEGVKDLAFARHDTTVIGSYRIVANDNYAEAALAA